MVFKKRTAVSRQSEQIISLWLVAFFIGVTVRSAWLTDDAYITFRTVDNFINGYGLTWNVTERVQAYTHPLWMLFVSAVYFFTREIFYSSLVLSILISLAAVLVFTFGLSRSVPGTLVGLAILTFSKAFVDYSTSGLENPLTHLIYVLFLWIYLQRELHLDTLFLLSLLAGLGLVNRLDTLLLFLPVLAYALFQVRRWKGLAVVGLGFLPFIAWESFSLFYYGFLFPNTAYAKLNTGVSSLELARQGLSYLLNSFRVDPLTLVVITTGTAIPLVVGDWRRAPIAAGLILYLLYVIRIGGDFMSGRFLTAPLLGAAVLVVTSPLVSRHIVRFLLLALVLGLGLLSPYPPPFSDADYGLNREDILDEHGISDHRAQYYKYSGLLTASRGPGLVGYDTAIKGQEARARGPAVEIEDEVGYFGFFAGPAVQVLDFVGLGDPLIARLPPTFDPKWRIGHFNRTIPSGYAETLRSGQNRITEPDLAAYYDKLALVTRGSLFDRQRLIEIWYLNTGKYDDLLAHYPPMFRVDLAEVGRVKEGPLWSQSDQLERYAGIQIRLGRLAHARRVQLSLVDSSDGHPMPNYQRDYYAVYYYGEVPVANQDLRLPGLPEKGGFTSTIEVPAEAAAQGYDSITILPQRGGNIHRTIYSIQQIRFLE